MVRLAPALLSLSLLACVVTPGPDGGAQIDAGEDGGVVVDAGLYDAGVDAGVSTTLVVKYDAAGSHSISVRGSVAPFSWDQGLPMQQLDSQTWSLTVTDVPGDFEWKPLRDDVWSHGPNYHAAAGATTQVQPRFSIDNGTWSVRWPSLSSTHLGNTRGVYVYLPPTYVENGAARMPVVYMHDGQNLFDPAVAFGGVTWNVAAAFDEAAGTGAFREAIVVGINNTADRIPEYTPTVDATYGGGNADAYLSFIVEELKPLVDAEYRTRSGREDTVVLGSSLGGLVSAYAGVGHAQVFGNVGALSPSTWWDDRVILTLVGQAGEPRPLRVYVDSGDSGPSSDGVTDTAALAQAYRDAGYVDGVTLLYLVREGHTHTEAAWAQRLPGALEFLLGPGR